MKRKHLLLICFVLFAISNNIAQNKNHKRGFKDPNKLTIKIKHYKAFFNTKLSKEEIRNLKIIGNDTIITISDPKKIRKLIGTAEKRGVKSKRQSRTYIPISQYKKIYNREITKEDIANFSFRNGDTLVLVSNKKFYKKGEIVPYQPKDSSFLETYKDVVYQKYSVVTSENKKRKDYMRLWRVPIKMFFAKSLDTVYKNALIKTAKTLSREVDSLNITFVNNIEESNYIVYQLDSKHRYKYAKRISNNNYINYYLYWKKSKIYDAKLEVNLTKFKNQSDYTNISYIIQKFFKSLGRFHESSKMPKRSILHTQNTNRKLISKQDIEILKYHYSFGICKGTDLEAFEENHRRAKEVFKNTGRHMNFMHIDN